MAPPEHTPQLVLLEEAITILFCQVDDVYHQLNPKAGRYASLKRLSDSEILALALFQQLRGIESEHSFLREVARFFSHLFPGIVGFWPSSFHRRVRKLRGYLEPLRRAILAELTGEPETMIVDSTLLPVLHPRQVSQGAGFEGAAWVRWGSFCVYGVKLHMLCATNRIPLSYELTPANVADLSLTEELLAEASYVLGEEEEEVARRLFADLAYQSEQLEEGLAEIGILLVTERVKQRRLARQQIEIAFASLKRVFGLGETLAKTLIGLAIRIAAKITAYTYAFSVNRLLGRPQGRIKDLWA